MSIAIVSRDMVYGIQAEEVAYVLHSKRYIIATLLRVQLQNMILHFKHNVNKSILKKWLTLAMGIVLSCILAFILSFSDGFLTNTLPSSEKFETQNASTTPQIATTTTDVLSSFPEITAPSTEEVIEDTYVSRSVHVEDALVQNIPVIVSPSPVSSPRIQTGVFAGTMPELNAFEDRVGAQVDIVATSVHWGNERDFPETYANLVTLRNSTLFIYWYPMDYNTGEHGQNAFHFKEILDGSWDEYIDSFAEEAKQNGGDIIIAPFEEVNGSWTYWNGESGTYGTKEEYVKTFRYLRDKFRVAPNVRFAWVVNQVSVPDTSENAIATYYPGDAYVDLIGINAFNFEKPWLSFDTLISRAVGDVLPYHKPIYITSTASAPGEQKATWIKDMFASQYFNTGTLKGLVWFNENKERDWRVWSDASSEEAFKTALTKNKE